MVVPVIAAAVRTTAVRKTKYSAVSERTQEALYERRNRELARMQQQGTGAKPSLILYLIVGMFAVLKDLLDFIGLIPAIGTVISFVFGPLMTLLIAGLLTLDRSGSGSNFGAAKGFMRRLGVLLAAMMVDVLPIINFLPITTLAVILLYWMAKREAKKSNRHQPSPYLRTA